MAKKLGNDYRLWVESSTPGTYNEIKGNQDLSISRDGAQVDTSTKSDFPYGTSAPGLRNLSIGASFIPDLPDANGYTRLMTLINAATTTPIALQIRKGGAAGADPADVVLEGQFYGTQANDGLGQNAPVTSQFTFVAAAAPTVDVLA